MSAPAVSPESWFAPLLARTRTTHAPVDPVAYDCVKVIVVRAGSALLFSEFGTRHVNVGDVIFLAGNTSPDEEPPRPPS